MKLEYELKKSARRTLSEERSSNNMKDLSYKSINFINYSKK